MWVDAERGGALLSEHEVRDMAGAVAGRLRAAFAELAGVGESALRDAVAGVLQEGLDRGAPEPAVLLEASEPTALQLVGLLRSHRRDRGGDTASLDTAAQSMRAFTGR